MYGSSLSHFCFPQGIGKQSQLQSWDGGGDTGNLRRNEKCVTGKCMISRQH